MQTLSFDVSGMACGGGTGSVQRALSKLDGISHAEMTLSPSVATEVVDPSRITATQIASAISELGYPTKERPIARNEQAES